MPNDNKIKGDAYEFYIRDYILSPSFTQKFNIIGCWLWKDIPPNHLYNAGFVNDFNQARLNRKNNINPFRDIGIDLIRVNNKYKYTLIQCKNYKDTVPQCDLAGFFMYLSCHTEKKGIIYYTNKITSNFNEIFGSNQTKRIQCIRKPMIINNQEKEDKEDIYELYDYQKNVFDTAINYYQNNNSGYISLPCGTGKTILSYFIANHINNLIIYIIPLKQHCQDIIERVKKYSNNTYHCILVDSDKGGCRDIEEIMKRINNNNKLFICATYKSCDIINKLLKDNETINPFIIIDEFHNLSFKNVYGCNQETYKKNLDNNSDMEDIGEDIEDDIDDEDMSDYNSEMDISDLDSDVDSDMDISDRDSDTMEEKEEKTDDIYEIINNDKYKRLFLSATPRIYELENNFDTEIESITGNCIYKMDFKYAIENKLITDYRIIFPIDEKEDNTQIEEIEEEIGDLEGDDIIKDNEIKDYTISKKMCFLYEAIKHYGNIKCIIYCRDTKEMKNMMKIFNELNKYFCYEYYCNYITCEVSQKERKKRLEEFRNYDGISLLFSVDILNEAIDIPECNSIYITYNSKSKITNIQRMCRSMRNDKNNNSKIANILVWCENENINNCVDIISSIKEYDNEFINKISFIKSENKFRSYNEIKETSKNKTDGCKKYIIGISEYRGEQWQETLDKVKQYIDENGKRPSLYSNFNRETKFLAMWIGTQQKNYKKNIYIMKNSNIRSKWEDFIEKYKSYFLSNEENWNNTLDKVKKYIDENKKRPNNNDKNIKTIFLARWIGTQQKNYKKNINIMNNPDIKKKWEEFVNNYKQYFLSNEEEWNNTLDKVIKYIDENKKRPSSEDKNKEIKRNGIWILVQIRNYKKNIYVMKNFNIKTKWEEFINNYKEYFKSNEEEWNETLDEAIKYINVNKKRPNKRDKHAKIKNLGIWISHQFNIYKKNTGIMKNSDFKKKWEDFIEKYKEYFISNDDIWHETLNNVIKYICENRNIPSTNDKQKEIKKLAFWISNQKSKYKNNTENMKNPNIKRKWEEFIDNYKQYFLSNEEEWNNTIDEVIKYIELNKKRPHNNDNAIKIKKLANWIGTQQKNYKKKIQIMKNPDIKSKWEEFINNYREYFIFYEEEWNETLDKLIKYIDVNKKRPNNNDKNKEIKFLARWIGIQQINYKKNSSIMKNPDIKMKWEEFIDTYKEYFISNEEKWNNTLDKVIKYINVNKKRPSNEDKNKEIKKLARWIGTQQNNYKKNKEIMKNLEIKNKWEEFIENYKEYFISNEQEWNNTLDEVMKYIDINKKRPNSKDNDIKIKKLVNWIYHQQQNYKKNKEIMKNQDIRTKWEEFIKNYKQYFKTSENETNDINNNPDNEKPKKITVRFIKK
jgi:superfamily II DNA or RNA helicase